MRAGIFSWFADKEVRVYDGSTQTAPLKIHGLLLQQAFPKVLGFSVLMTAASCQQPHRPSVEAFYFNRPTVSIDDSTYNHIITDSVHFLNVLAKGGEYIRSVEDCDTLSEAQKDAYKNYFSGKLRKIHRDDTGALDLRHPETMKTFLAFEKLAYYKGGYQEVMYREPGLHDEKSPLLGLYYQDWEALYQTAEKNPQIKTFARELYNSESRFIIDEKMIDEANRLSMDDLDGWLKKYRTTAEEAVYYGTINMFWGSESNLVISHHQAGKDLSADVYIDKTGSNGDGTFGPLGNTIQHELLHVMQQKPGGDEQKDSRMCELGPTLHSLMRDDEIYKRIKGIPLEKTLDYGSLRLGKRSVGLGQIANDFRQLMRRSENPDRVDGMLASPAGVALINKWMGRETQPQAVRLPRDGR